MSAHLLVPAGEWALPPLRAGSPCGLAAPAGWPLRSAHSVCWSLVAGGLAAACSRQLDRAPPCPLAPPAGAEQRCNALLLFYSITFAFLLPLLLLVPLRHQGSPAAASAGQDGQARRSSAAQLDDWLESWLRLLWSPAAGREPVAPRASGAAPSQLLAPQQQQGKAERPFVRWWLLLSLIWSLCCVAQT